MNHDLEAYFEPLSEAAPSGSDLEYDPDFARMEQAALGTPDQEFGSTHIEAQPPDWGAVLDACQSLLSRSKDLRVASCFSEAKLVLEGIRGFRDGLMLVAGFTEKFWESVFPQLDADDDDDPTIRINALMSLSKTGGLIRQLRETPILLSRAVGRFTLIDVAIARGEIPAPRGMTEPPTQKKIDAAVQSCDVKELRELQSAVDDCLQAVAVVDKTFGERLGYATGPNLEPLTKELKGIGKHYKTWLDQLKSLEPPEPVVAAVASGEAAAANSLITATANTPERVVVMGAGSFAIGRREDALEALDKIVRWFERYEPSSPLPMLLRRALRLSKLSFMEILRDLSPDGLPQAELIIGQSVEEDSVEQYSSGTESEPDVNAAPRVAPAPDSY